ncbi:C3a anaphylatoxin chemotactic receptor-like [Gastrophryne carolinensis]
MNTTSDLLSGQNHSHHVFTVLVMVVTFLVGVPGNLLVIWVTSMKMKWTVNTIWFWNLAVADVICCLSIPLSVAQLFYSQWLYGAALCKILPIIVQLNMFASVFTLVVISIDRCTLVVRPVWAQNHRSVRLAWMLCLVIWILAIFMCLPAAIFRKHSTDYNKTLCYNDFGEPDYEYYETSFDYEAFYSENNTNLHLSTQTPVHSTELTITLTRMVFGFLIPLLIIFVCYLQLTLKVQNTRFVKAGKKTTKVVFGIIIAFFITWAPYHILGMMMLYPHDKIVEHLDHLSVSLAYFNSCINPILYVFMGKDMKRKVRKSIHELMESAFSEEVSRSTERTRSKITEDSMAV